MTKRERQPSRRSLERAAQKDGKPSGKVDKYAKGAKGARERADAAGLPRVEDRGMKVRRRTGATGVKDFSGDLTIIPGTQKDGK